MNRCAGTATPVERILRTMVRRRFPELARLKIPIRFEECDALLRCDGLEITVHPSLKHTSRRVLEGGIAHELAHILHDSALKPAQRERALDVYLGSLAYRIRDERRADLRAIERGYGPQLLALLSWARGMGHRFCREHGLSVAEIRKRI